jgi:hypothetical protein
MRIIVGVMLFFVWIIIVNVIGGSGHKRAALPRIGSSIHFRRAITDGAGAGLAESSRLVKGHEVLHWTRPNRVKGCSPDGNFKF